MDLDTEELEQELCRIPEVFAARIVVNGSGRPTEVRILASPDRPPKRVRRDVQSVALASFDIELPSSAISVTQIEQAARLEQVAAPATTSNPGPPAEGDRAAHAEPEPPATPEEPSPAIAPPEEQQSAPAAEEPATTAESVGTVESRALSGPAELESITTTTDRRLCVVEVELRRGAELATGRAEGALTRSIVARLAAAATLSALRQVQPEARGLELEELAVSQLGRHRVATVLLAVSDGAAPGRGVASGSETAGEAGDLEAVVLAVLDAARRALAD